MTTLDARLEEKLAESHSGFFDSATLEVERGSDEKVREERECVLLTPAD